MARLRLLHWKASEAELILRLLKDAGHSVEYREQFQTELMRAWRVSPPDAFVIDLSRLPSHGKEIAIALRRSPATRATPIVFCQGEPTKVAAVRALLPDELYCDLTGLKSSLNIALHREPRDSALPVAMMDRYRDRTAAQKLGIRPGSKIALLAPPPALASVLGELPGEIEFVEEQADITLCFLHGPDSMRQSFSDLRSRAGKTRLWMLWRKKTSNGHSGVTEPAVREVGQSLGLVDYKICSVDKNWSAMLFARKR